MPARKRTRRSNSVRSRMRPTRNGRLPAAGTVASHLPSRLKATEQYFAYRQLFLDPSGTCVPNNRTRHVTGEFAQRDPTPIGTNGNLPEVTFDAEILDLWAIDRAATRPQGPDRAETRSRRHRHWQPLCCATRAPAAFEWVQEIRFQRQRRLATRWSMGCFRGQRRSPVFPKVSSDPERSKARDAAAGLRWRGANLASCPL